MAYQIGQATLAVGGAFLCLLLFRTRLIPRGVGLGLDRLRDSRGGGCR